MNNEYPEFLTETKELLISELKKRLKNEDDTVEFVANEAVEFLRTKWGGIPIYVPKNVKLPPKFDRNLTWITNNIE